jgi:hypothetical protein
VYIESSVISYLTARPSRDLVTAANQKLTQLWWRKPRSRFDLYVSEMVILEVGKGDAEAAMTRLAVAEQIPSVTSTLECSLLAEHLMQASRLPQAAARDAFHIAIAAIHRMDFLLTWNCRHIANAVLMPEFSAIMSSWGYVSPVICTPSQLLQRGFIHEDQVASV